MFDIIYSFPKNMIKMVFITMSLFILNSAISVEKCLELKLATFSCIEFLHGLITK